MNEAYSVAEKAKPIRNVVRKCLIESQGLAANRMSRQELVETVRAGVSFAEFEQLQKSLGVTSERLAELLNISKSTLMRRRESGRLDLAQSDRVIRLARLVGLAVQALDTLDHAREWLLTPQIGLAGEIPLEYAITEIGAREVEDLLGRIEFGVYS